MCSLILSDRETRGRLEFEELSLSCFLSDGKQSEATDYPEQMF